MQRENLNIVIAGHVDHGKSTIIGRLMADTDSLPEGRLEFVKEACRRNSKPFEYAFLLDALKDEQTQGITIDSARCFFRTEKRDYIIIDAPGHIEFLKNMVTGASRAEAALLVIDACEGVQENSRRHGYMLSMLGINQVVVLVNKMDLMHYRSEIFESIKKEYLLFLQQIGIEPTCFIPVSGMRGDNIASVSKNMSWWNGGRTVLETLDSFECTEADINKPFRMPVQGVYKFTRNGDNRRIIAGTVEAGRLTVGDEVVFYPTGKKSRVKSIEAFNTPSCNYVKAGSASGFTLSEQIFVSRGEVAALAGQTMPCVTSRISVNIFWLGKEPMKKGVKYLLKLGTAKIGAVLEEITRVVDASTLEALKKDFIDKHDVAECIIKLDRDIAFDMPENVIQTSRFVVVDNYEIAGGGIARQALDDSSKDIREKVYLRNIKWEKSQLSEEQRADRYNQKSALVLVTGKKDINRKEIAKALEKKLFEEGKHVYFFSMGNLLYGLDADIKLSLENNKIEHFRRLAELANIMLDAGIILIVSVIELSKADIKQLMTGINYEKIETVWLGDDITTDADIDLQLPSGFSPDKTVARIKEHMQKKGIIFKPW